MKQQGGNGAVVAAAALVIAAALLVGCSSASRAASTTTSAPPASTTTSVPALGPESVPIPSGPVLGAVDSARYPQTIDGIKCETSEQLVYHIHAHLTIFVNGQARQVPYGIGIAPPIHYSTTGGIFVDGGVCFYWLHTHSSDGIIHIESPTQTTYTLGQFFDVWGQSLGANQVGTASGPLTIFVDGQPYHGDPRAISLPAHSQIQLDVGSPAPAPTLITFPRGL